ncbi:hypothetical protein Ddc_23527 [Ditylenchus destructor]|nr:hypothetical protein Ddc_23527 [Ditylenchus destructor]
MITLSSNKRFIIITVIIFLSLAPIDWVSTAGDIEIKVGEQRNLAWAHAVGHGVAPAQWKSKTQISNGWWIYQEKNLIDDSVKTGFIYVPEIGRFELPERLVRECINKQHHMQEPNAHILSTQFYSLSDDKNPIKP